MQQLRRPGDAADLGNSLEHANLRQFHTSPKVNSCCSISQLLRMIRLLILGASTHRESTMKPSTHTLKILLAMAFVVACKGISLPKLGDLPLLFVLGFFAVSLHHVALNIGKQNVSAGASSVLAQSTPLFSTLLARFVFKDRVSAWRCGCVLLGLIGVVIVVAGDRGLGSMDAHGLLILLAAVSWSFYFALQKHHCARYNGLTLVCYTVWSGTALLLIYLPGLAGKVASAPMQVQMTVVALGVFPSALAYLAWAFVLAHIDLSRATMTLYLIPPTAMAIAAFALGEQPTLMVGIGAMVVLISVLALNLERRS